MLPLDSDKGDGLPGCQPPPSAPHSGGDSQQQQQPAPAPPDEQHRAHQANPAAVRGTGLSSSPSQSAYKQPAESEGAAKYGSGGSQSVALCGDLGRGCGSAGSSGDSRGDAGGSYDGGSIVLNDSSNSNTVKSGAFPKKSFSESSKSSNFYTMSSLPSRENPHVELEATESLSLSNDSDLEFLIPSGVHESKSEGQFRVGTPVESSTVQISCTGLSSPPSNPSYLPKAELSNTLICGAIRPLASDLSLPDYRSSSPSLAQTITPATTGGESNLVSNSIPPHSSDRKLPTGSDVTRPVADSRIHFVTNDEVPFASHAKAPLTVNTATPTTNAAAPTAKVAAPVANAATLTANAATPTANAATPTANAATPTTNAEATPSANAEVPPPTNIERPTSADGGRVPDAAPAPPGRRPPPPNNLNALRERMFHSLFLRLSVAYARCTTPQIRRLFEFVLLLKSVVCLVLLVVVHWLLGSRAPACLPPDTAWDSSGILRVEVVRAAGGGYSLWQSYRREELLQRHLMLEAGGGLLAALAERAGALDLEALEEELDSVLYPGSNSTDGACKSQRLPNPLLLHAHPTCPVAAGEADDHYEEILISPPHIMEYALEYGLLRLSSAARQRLKVPVTLVVLDPDEHSCFGDTGTGFLIEEVIGYDDLLLAALKQLAESDGGKGYLRNAMTGEHYRFVSLWLAGSSYVGAALVMLVFTLSVSLLLRYSHHQIFLFIVHLLHVMEMNTAAVAAFPAAPLLTVVLALVGMEAIMSEFFKDTSTAFYIIVLVWLCDQYEALCCTQPITRKHWLRFFYLYHFAFYAYHYRFNGQYSWLALMTSWFFLQHSMLYFFHHYELPAMLRSRPRLQAVNIVIRRPVPAQAPPPQEPP